MTTTFARLCLAIAVIATMPSIALAHIKIAPSESVAGATENVETVGVPNGWKHEIKRQGDRIVAITWTMHIPPGEFVEFAFVARNPRDKAELVWTLRQRFADGTVSDWTKGPTGIRPTAVTKLAPRPSQ